MKTVLCTLLFTLILTNSFGQCSPVISANTASDLYTGDTLYGGNHHLCFNSYTSYFGNGPDTIYLEPQSSLTIIWSDQLVLYVSKDANVFKGGNGTNSYIIKELFYDTPSDLTDTSNMTIQSSTYCPGMNYDYIQMTPIPDQGCIGTASIEKLSAKTFNVFPNPSSGSFTIETVEAGEMSLFNLAGNKMMNQTLDNGQNTINGEYLSSGIYLVRIKFGSSVSQSKLVIE